MIKGGMPKLLLYSIALALASCVRPPSMSPPLGGEVITYEWSPGPFNCDSPRCASHKIVAVSDGRLAIEATKFDRLTGGLTTSRWTSRLAPDQLLLFWERLAVYRPRGEQVIDGRTCRAFASDSAEVRITWQNAATTDRLVYNFGCEAPERQAMATALHSAPSLIPLKYLQTLFSEP